MVKFDVVFVEKPPKGWSLKDQKCEDCALSWTEMEYYMVHNQIWNKHGVGKGHLCFDCLERRLGRNLKHTDFTDAPINKTIIRIFKYFAKKLKSNEV